MDRCAIVLICAVTLLGCGGGRESVDLSKVQHRLTTDQAFEEIEANKVAFEHKYEGKVVQVTGPVSDIGGFDGKSLHVGEGLNYVDCDYTASSQDVVLELRKGQAVTITGVLSISTWQPSLTPCNVSK